MSCPARARRGSVVNPVPSVLCCVFDEPRPDGQFPCYLVSCCEKANVSLLLLSVLLSTVFCVSFVLISINYLFCYGLFTFGLEVYRRFYFISVEIFAHR